ncbi:transcriptional adapter 2-alpha [Neocloeon triangulifer]|uniref:transcriptional adapter 2-alpha n=1 Tax=Neocloeon triangulifer TaxID=2078957 RepID=UPI00286F4579|nr:transcriptional adapter 2-alpha [Neocloeon triangulifer]
MSADSCCFCCEVVLREPYIKCVDCVASVCPRCFSRGAERGPHQSWHSYDVRTDNIPVLEDGWSLRDERRLLDAMLTCGYGNWVDISRKLKRPPEECKDHYDKFHLQTENESFIRAPLPPHLLKITTDQPPRMIVQASGTYNSLRSEIWPEFDTGAAEIDLSQCISPEDCADCDPSMLELCEALQEAMVNIYNDRLRERARKHRVIREHGLVKRYYNYQKRYSALSPFSTILNGYQMDFLMVGLSKAEELRVRFVELCELRTQGIKTRRAAEVMKRLAALRQEQAKNMKNWAPIKMDPKGIHKREMRPLQVTGLPLSERLSNEERELCAQARLVPESFFQFKQILVSECNKQRGLKLAQARKVIKIDVNKTRKLFDFLINTGVIYPPPVED